MSTRNPDPAYPTTYPACTARSLSPLGGIGRAAGLTSFGLAKTIAASEDDYISSSSCPSPARGRRPIGARPPRRRRRRERSCMPSGAVRPGPRLGTGLKTYRKFSPHSHHPPAVPLRAHRSLLDLSRWL
jgi:hypothetical protein